MSTRKNQILNFDLRVIDFFKQTFIPFARFSLFLVFFWFGMIKLLGFSPASPLAEALVAHTVGLMYFQVLFVVLALLEVVIGLLFLFPRATRIVIPLLLLHMLIVCSPLLLVPDYTWQGFFLPTLEGQYIIKNAVVVAVAIGVAASTKPLKK
ncbi:MAG: hypothetical protein Q7T74_04295 [Candidatus Saccharibacteria bacterium]|nr:hypothetical protein [Candidatus Saccharibacteria bacterium]